MITNDLSTLKIHKLSQAQYDRELAAGNIDTNALYLTPDEEIDLSVYETKVDAEEKYNELLQKTAPSFSPVREIAPSGSSGGNSYVQYIDASCNGITFLVSSKNIPSYAPSVCFCIYDDDDVPVGLECEFVWVGGQKPVEIQPVNLDGVWLCDLHHTLSDATTAKVTLSALYSVAVLKKIGTRSWVISGDITL